LGVELNPWLVPGKEGRKGLIRKVKEAGKGEERLGRAV
jgi:hypothetical protein